MAVFLGCTSTGRVGLWFLLFYVQEHPKGSTGSGSGFKASQKTGQWLKVSSDRLGEAGGNQTKIKIFKVLNFRDSKLKTCRMLTK